MRYVRTVPCQVLTSQQVVREDCIAKLERPTEGGQRDEREKCGADAEHKAFFDGENDTTGRALRDLIEVVGELDYGTIPDYEES